MAGLVPATHAHEKAVGLLGRIVFMGPRQKAGDDEKKWGPRRNTGAGDDAF
jgi:hypothetical protein